MEREVDYERYCKICLWKDTPDDDDPCNECLTQGWNNDSRKPICYKPISTMDSDIPKRNRRRK